MTEFPIRPQFGPYRIASGPDGNLWFTSEFLGRITTSGAVSQFAGTNTSLGDITSGPDGNVWFTEFNGIGRITASGLITEYSFPAPESRPYGMTLGPDGNLWVAEMNDRIARVAVSSKTAPWGVDPAYGIGMGPSTTYTFSGAGGWQNLSVVNVLVNNSLTTHLKEAFCWLPGMDSNHDSRLQRPLSYH